MISAVRGQVERSASDYLDAVFLYDGPLQTAIQTHLSQSVLDKMNTFAFIAFSDEQPITLAASGLPLQTGLYLDINVLVRSQGVSHYEDDLERLFDAVDCVAQESFCNSCSGLSQEYKDIILKTEFVSRQRIDTFEILLGHVVRIMVKV